MFVAMFRLRTSLFRATVAVDVEKPARGEAHQTARDHGWDRRPKSPPRRPRPCSSRAAEARAAARATSRKFRAARLTITSDEHHLDGDGDTIVVDPEDPMSTQTSSTRSISTATTTSIDAHMLELAQAPVRHLAVSARVRRSRFATCSPASTRSRSCRPAPASRCAISCPRSSSTASRSWCRR